VGELVAGGEAVSSAYSQRYAAATAVRLPQLECRPWRVDRSSGLRDT
jgi:hypothetical protein